MLRVKTYNTAGPGMISRITAAETRRRRSFGEGKKLMSVSMQRFNDGSKGAAILMILPRCHHPPMIHHGSVPAAHLARLFFTAYNPLPSAKSGSIGSSAVEEKMAAPDIVWKGGRFGRTSRRDPWW